IAAAKKWQTYRTKQQRAVTIVVVTDEAGSDAAANLEAAILETKRFGMKCFVIGEGAPLGREKVESMFTLDSGETVIGVMDRGPESYFQERLRLAFWGVNGYDLDSMPSGFGPYGLTRLCAETNGLYLISEVDNKFSDRIDPIVMRSYPPDYRPIPMLQRDIESNLAKRAVFEVCKKYQVENLPIPTDRFPAENDTVLKQNITDAQKPLAELDYKLDGILKMLEAGEKDRAKIQDPRWRAIYDLTMGRVLAMRVRSYGYNMMLAEMKASPKQFEKKESNLWTLKASKDITSGPASKKMANKAQEYLKRVIDEHAGTPWAVLAEREYSTQLGWEWKEGSYNTQQKNMGNNKEKKAPRFVEDVDPKTGKKTKRQLPDQPVRREI
ncbi:MAG: VWA domain-containing protein, partial [Planctomycetaceae bacterium]|nr:VWA domain-containing protein [Planctomycetaceae bacterium]